MSVLSEVADVRERFVKRHMAAVLDPMEGEFTSEQYEAVEREAHETWRRNYPCLTEFLIPVGDPS